MKEIERFPVLYTSELSFIFSLGLDVFQFSGLMQEIISVRLRAECSFIRFLDKVFVPLLFGEADCRFL